MVPYLLRRISTHLIHAKVDGSIPTRPLCPTRNPYEGIISGFCREQRRERQTVKKKWGEGGQIRRHVMYAEHLSTLILKYPIQLEAKLANFIDEFAKA